MKNYLKILAALIALSVPAQAQQYQPGNVVGNPGASLAPGKGAPLTQYLDRNFSSTQGSILFRNATGWVALAPGTAGTLLSSQGAGANIVWSPVTFPTSGISGGIPCWLTTTTFGSSVLLTQNALILGGGSGACPSPLGSLGTTTTLLHGNASGAPTFGSVVIGDLSSALLATAAQYIAGTANVLVAPNIAFTVETTTTFGTTTTFDFSTFINTAVTLTGNITTMSVANIKAGQAGQIRFIQDGTGSRTSVFNSVFKFTGGATPVLSTAAGDIDVLFYSCISTTLCYSSLSLNMR